MGSAKNLTVDPGSLRLPPTMIQGADPAKLQRQISTFGRSSKGMLPIVVYRAADDELVIYDGVTRATRLAKLAPGKLVSVLVIGRLKTPGKAYPTVKEKLP